jgi:hypothetical protein
MDLNEADDLPKPPDAARVAARALVLAAVSCRAIIEKDANDPDAEELRQDVVRWLDRVGAAAELEPEEADLLAVPVGRLDHKTTIKASWQSEGMAVLAWALRRATLPPIHMECNPSEVASAMGFLDDRYRTPLGRPDLRDAAEIEHCANKYLTANWRFRQFLTEPNTIDFRSYIARCKWADLTNDGLEFISDDLAIDGVRIDELDERSRHHVGGIVQERHQAVNWLLGWESLYSEVTTDT